MVDRSGNGAISTKELEQVLGTSLAKMSIQQMVHEADTNGDGVIDFEEFKVIYNKAIDRKKGNDEIADLPPLRGRDVKALSPEVESQRRRIAERKAQEQKDRIFGLKNKHTSKHAQQFVQDVERNMKQLPGEQQKAEAKKRENDKRKAAEEQAQRELDEMMGLAIKQPKVPEGVDPKTFPCEFFKKGRCAKGWKCKFSHEKNTRKGTEKIDLFVDHRDDAEKEKDSDKMDDWDQDKLESVVKEKHSGENQNNKTDIVCKHFLEAVEKRLYGWFWVCPNGGNECKYRHALPSGYVLKSQLKAMMEEEKASQRTDEEILEEERAKIGEGVPVTQDTFAEWKRARDARVAQSKADVKQRRIDEGRLSGRELCEGGLVESCGHEEAGAMEYIKRDTSADDAAEARAKEEAERNLARMRAMFSASGGVEGGDRSEWFAQGGQDDEDDDFFVDDDDLDPDELAAMLEVELDRHLGLLMLDWCTHKDLARIACWIEPALLGTFVKAVMRVVSYIEVLKEVVLGLGFYEVHNRMDAHHDALLGGLVTNESLYLALADDQNPDV